MENYNLSQLIDTLKENCTLNFGEIREPILKAISDVQNQLNSDFINLVFLGTFNEGKTTMINSIIACLTNNYDNNLRLISSGSENTYFPTVIERSSDNYYYMTIIQSNIAEESKFSNPQEINQKLEEFDKNSIKYLKDLENYERETNEEKRKELKDRIKEILIKIKIPNFPSDLRLIDCPGFTNKMITERVFKLINENYILSVFIYLRSFTQEKVTTDEVIYEFYKKIKDNYHNSIFCLCLTKYDLFVKNYLEGSNYYKLDKDKDPQEIKEKDREAMKLIEKFQNFKKEMKDFSNYVKISKIFIMDNKNVLHKSLYLNENPRKQVKNFIEYINKMKLEKCEFIKRVYFIINMRIRLYEINQKYSYNELLNEDEKNILQNLVNLSHQNFKDELENWKWCFPSNYKNFKNKYELKINTLKVMFNQNDATILKDKKFAIKDNYIRAQYELLLPEMTEVIEHDIINFIYDSYDNLIKKLPDSLKKKFKNLILENGECYNSKETNILMKGTLGSLIGISVGFSVKLSVFEFLSNTTGFAFLIGPNGWIIGGVLGVGGCLLFSLSNYIGIWKRLSCFDDTLESFYNLTNKNLDNIINISSDKYECVISKFKDILLNSKQTLDEINKLYDILSCYNVKRNINLDETFEEVFKKALIEFEEKNEIKNIFEKIIN